MHIHKVIHLLRRYSHPDAVRKATALNAQSTHQT